MDKLDRQQILDGVRDIIAGLGHALDPKTIGEDAVFDEHLNMDSLDVVEVTIKAEDTFGIEIADAELDDISTVGKLVDVIHMKHRATF